MAGTHDRLLDAATSVFAAKGYSATSVQDVADVVGIQKSSVYKHVRSKEELLVAVLDRGHRVREAVLDEIAGLDAAPLDRLREYLRRYALSMLTHHELTAVFSGEWVHLTEQHRTADLHRRRQRRRFLTELVDAVAGHDTDPTLVATYLRGALHATRDWYRDGGPDPLPGIAKTVADVGCVVVTSARRPVAPLHSGSPERGAARAPRTRRDAIDDAALRIVRAKGFAATTVQDIAAEVGVLKGSMYHYIGSKDELLMRIFETAHLELTTIVGTVAQLDATPAEQLCELVRLQVTWFLDNQDQAVVLFREWPFLTGTNRDLVASRRKDLERFAARLFDQACAAGEIPHGAGAGTTVRFALGAANAVSDWYRPGGVWDPSWVATGYAQLTGGLLLGR
jgi:AcrR family transcriptional regulator